MARVNHFEDPAAPPATCIHPTAFAVVRDDGDRILLVRRTDDGLWELPGGRVEIGESAAEATQREVAEESGVTVKVTRLAGVYTDPTHVIAYPATGEVRQQFAVCFHALPIGGEPTPDGDETCEVAWVPVDRIDRLPMHPTMRRRLIDAVSAPNQLHHG
jgi:ADP-ribose pyrophosphatase YjhB (NUDIX family)